MRYMPIVVILFLLSLVALPTGYGQTTTGTTALYLPAVFKPLPTLTPTPHSGDGVYVVTQRMYFYRPDNVNLYIIGILANGTNQTVYNVGGVATCYDGDGTNMPLKDRTGGALLARIEPGATSPYLLAVNNYLTPLTAVQRCSIDFTWDTQSPNDIRTLTVLSQSLSDSIEGIFVEGNLDPTEAATERSNTVVSLFDAQGQLLGVGQQSLGRSRYPPYILLTYFNIPVDVRFGKDITTVVVQSQGIAD